MEIGTAKIPFLCIPESRPFDEQKIKAQILEKLGLCLVEAAFPCNNAIGFILKRLKLLDLGEWDRIMADDGAVRAAIAIESEVKLLNSWHTASKSRLGEVRSGSLEQLNAIFDEVSG